MTPKTKIVLQDKFQSLIKSRTIIDSYSFQRSTDNIVLLHIGWQFQMIKIGYELGDVERCPVKLEFSVDLTITYKKKNDD